MERARGRIISPAMPDRIAKKVQARSLRGAVSEGATMNAMDRRVFAESTVDVLPYPSVLRGEARPDLLRDELLRFLHFGLQVKLKSGDLGIQHHSLALKQKLLRFNFLLGQHRRVGVFRLLHNAAGASQQSRFAQIDLTKFDAIIG